MSPSLEQHTRHQSRDGPSDSLVAWQPLPPSLQTAHALGAMASRLLNGRFIAATDRCETEGQDLGSKGYKARWGMSSCYPSRKPPCNMAPSHQQSVKRWKENMKGCSPRIMPPPGGSARAQSHPASHVKPLRRISRSGQ